MNTKIKEAIEYCGSKIALARACGVTHGAVNKWLKGGGIDSKYLLRIEQATEGKVTIREICEELENENRI
ncbi:transcriptional regulator [Actinobacillus porcitonsillarum]|uniref:Transcriptional regulator n=1 Tax=Actinobacillus porcitonsillarum TaxID=189834 RepID=A0A2U8FK76_9PAST|nr:Cro/CI family transcriptional regulator [Actinobacillus porcitonsillarum]AWI51389.1 transcriptional regulator [Actinobacillus porcitonsillarum]